MSNETQSNSNPEQLLGELIDQHKVIAQALLYLSDTNPAIQDLKGGEEILKESITNLLIGIDPKLPDALNFLQDLKQRGLLSTSVSEAIQFDFGPEAASFVSRLESSNFSFSVPAPKEVEVKSAKQKTPARKTVEGTKKAENLVVPKHEILIIAKPQPEGENGINISYDNQECTLDAQEAEMLRTIMLFSAEGRIITSQQLRKIAGLKDYPSNIRKTIEKKLQISADRPSIISDGSAGEKKVSQYYIINPDVKVVTQLVLDTKLNTLSVWGKTHQINDQQKALIHTLAKNPGKPVSFEQIWKAAYGDTPYSGKAFGSFLGSLGRRNIPFGQFVKKSDGYYLLSEDILQIVTSDELILPKPFTSESTFDLYKNFIMDALATSSEPVRAATLVRNLQDQLQYPDIRISILVGKINSQLEAQGATKRIEHSGNRRGTIYFIVNIKLDNESQGAERGPDHQEFDTDPHIPTFREAAALVAFLKNNSNRLANVGVTSAPSDGLYSELTNATSNDANFANLSADYQKRQIGMARLKALEKIHAILENDPEAVIDKLAAEKDPRCELIIYIYDAQKNAAMLQLASQGHLRAESHVNLTRHINVVETFKTWLDIEGQEVKNSNGGNGENHDADNSGLALETRRIAELEEKVPQIREKVQNAIQTLKSRNMMGLESMTGKQIFNAFHITARDIENSVEKKTIKPVAGIAGSAASMEFSIIDAVVLGCLNRLIRMKDVQKIKGRESEFTSIIKQELAKANRLARNS